MQKNINREAMSTECLLMRRGIEYRNGKKNPHLATILSSAIALFPAFRALQSDDLKEDDYIYCHSGGWSKEFTTLKSFEAYLESIHPRERWIKESCAHY